MNTEQLPNKIIACLDMRSFYASCAAIDAGLDPMEAYIAVVGNQERKGSVVLAASPRMKKEFGVRTGTRLFEIPGDPRIRLLEPKMEFFLKVSMAITELLGEYVPKECVHVYSVDESFVDFTHVNRLWGECRRCYWPYSGCLDPSIRAAVCRRRRAEYAAGEAGPGSGSEEDRLCQVGV